MSRRAILLVATMAAALVAASGVAWAATIQCPGGFCQGTAKSDVIRGTDAFDRIIAWGGNDTVSGFGTGDEIYGVFGNDKLSGGPEGITWTADPATTSSLVMPATISSTQ